MVSQDASNEQETKSEPGFVYTFGCCHCTLHVGANRDSPLHAIEPNKSSANTPGKTSGIFFVRNVVSTRLTVYHEAEYITKPAVHAFAGIRLFHPGILFHHHLYQPKRMFIRECCRWKNASE